MSELCRRLADRRGDLGQKPFRRTERESPGREDGHDRRQDARSELKRRLLDRYVRRVDQCRALQTIQRGKRYSMLYAR